ncbi:hypothetical protein RB2551 [Rhodopirellula baltica SH 1]|uniref:Uncharacterized protein n=1 Tax=Rhodopirellula baltica (strain DSM 10527 / NCIMB 13988 / SH1) TaxID=243090 RepID=Q7UVL5_RHOBA|nr:hypothetical protein RB2551 [Rhodopirellula baltica SH 1]
MSSFPLIAKRCRVFDTGSDCRSTDRLFGFGAWLSIAAEKATTSVRDCSPPV